MQCQNFSEAAYFDTFLPRDTLDKKYIARNK